jgi:hypothetical protein
MVCGRYIPQEMLRTTNFPHVEGAACRSDYDSLNVFLLTCAELHLWQHNQGANNLKSHPCVRFFLINYWNGGEHRKFYQRFIRERKLFEYE